MAKKLKNILIVANWQKNNVKEISNEIINYLKQININSTLFITNSNSSQIDYDGHIDLVISLGGDGTVLYCVRHLQDLGVPILPVNMGTFGYITEVSVNEWKDTLNSYINGGNKHLLHKRSTIKATIIRKGDIVFGGTALNEVVVTSNGLSKVITLDMSVDNTFLGSFRADGMIVSTPTGSTGYSLAAGGPIVDNDLSALVCTPICPFTLSNRPLVVSSERRISLKILENQRTEVMVNLDGQVNTEVFENDIVEIRKSRTKAILLVTNNRTNFDILRDKLNWSGGRGNA
ncbi:MAG: NAD(+)/NADH kinase [Spirochaetia bacterium]|nr:NAD(+)/NADH kinase [Spirochaetia bacterium]